VKTELNKPICLDTGLITLNYAKEIPESVFSLFNEIKLGYTPVFLTEIVLVEAYTKITQSFGKEFAQAAINNFIAKIPFTPIIIDLELIKRAGNLKMMYIRKLSYTDCISIAFCIQNKIKFHTTEKELPILSNLIVKKHYF